MRLPASCVQCTRAGRRQSRRVMGDHSGSGEGYFLAKHVLSTAEGAQRR
jgi:hypothetical protein